MDLSVSRSFWVMALTGGLLTACMAGAWEPDPSVAVEPEPAADDASHQDADEPHDDADGPRPATLEDGPQPKAALEAAALAPTTDEIQALLTDAAARLGALGVDKRPIRHLRGPHPDHSGLDEAYEEKRALGYEGKLEEVQTWMGLAKFGTPQASERKSTGALARYDLCVTRAGAKAWLHVLVPAHGLADEEGQHFKAESREKWVLLSDRAEPGVDYVPFKRSAAPSLSRQWGREKLIDDLVMIMARYKQRTGVRLGIGDISHSTGGKMKDHWTHRVGADVDLYLLDYPDGELDPVIVFHSYKRGRSVWSTREGGKGTRERPAREGGETATGARLRTLAELVFDDDDVAYFVHNDPVVLSDFDERVAARKPGRRFLHAKNKGYWPVHDDHVHLRWVDGVLPVGVTPRP